MKHNADELKKAEELYRNNFNNLPIEMRKALASPYNRWLENELAIKQAEKHLADMKKRRGELEDWMIDWYREQNKERKESK